MELRPALQADAATVRACIERAYAEYQGVIKDLPPVAEGVEDAIRASGVWVAAHDGAVAGAIILDQSGGAMVLANLAVDPAFRGQGLGGRLIALAEEEARKGGFAEMRLTTHKDMPKNVLLYERMGWAIAKRDGNRVFMAKRLTG